MPETVLYTYLPVDRLLQKCRWANGKAGIPIRNMNLLGLLVFLFLVLRTIPVNEFGEFIYTKVRGCRYYRCLVRIRTIWNNIRGIIWGWHHMALC